MHRLIGHSRCAYTNMRHLHKKIVMLHVYMLRNASVYSLNWSNSKRRFKVSRTTRYVLIIRMKLEILYSYSPAMQTSQLHMIPLVKACKKVSDVLAEAIPIAVPGLDTTPPCTAKNTINSDLAKTNGHKNIGGDTTETCIWSYEGIAIYFEVAYHITLIAQYMFDTCTSRLRATRCKT